MPDSLAIDLNMLLRLAVALLLSGVIGYERETRHKPAGLRTHMLIGMGSTLFMIVGELSITAFQPRESEIRWDPTRVLQAVVTGIGFLGGGAILSGSRHVRGLTTAASIWTTAGIGLLVGIQRYTLAAGATLLAFIVLRYFTKFEAEITETKNEDAA